MVYTLRYIAQNITFPYLTRTQNRLAGCFKTYSCTIWAFVFVMWSTGDCKLGLARTKGVPLAATEPIRLPSLYSVLMAHVRTGMCAASDEIVQTAVFRQMFTEQEGTTIKFLGQTWFEPRLITRYLACFYSRLFSMLPGKLRLCKINLLTSCENTLINYFYTFRQLGKSLQFLFCGVLHNLSFSLSTKYHLFDKFFCSQTIHFS